MDLIDEILRKILPTELERNKIDRVTKETKYKLDSAIKKLELDADTLLVGSIAKDTYLNSTDIDFFVRFSKNYTEEQLKSYIIKIGSQIFKEFKMKYAQHPYVSGEIEKIEVELVPCYRIEKPSQKISTVDRTPFHTEFILKNLKNSQKNEVRLLKAFLKGIEIYGAEAKIEGFSGYLTELLILKFGTFMNLLQESSKWGEYTVLKHDIEIDAEQKRELIQKFNTPLIYLDPVDNDRNVAAALSRNNYSLFKFAAMTFLKTPSSKFFFRADRIMNVNEIIEKISDRGSKITILRMPIPDIVDDILYPQIYRFKKILEIGMKDFGVINIFHSVSDSYLFIVIETAHNEIPRIIKHEGPPLWSLNIDNFIEKWKDNKNVLRGPYIENDRLYVDIRNENYSFVTKLNYELWNANIGKNLNFSKNKVEVLDFEVGIRTIPISDLYKMFCFKFPWDY